MDGMAIQAFSSCEQIEGMDRDGLLHISCLSTCRVEKVEDVLTVGDKVWVKVRLFKFLRNDLVRYARMPLRCAPLSLHCDVQSCSSRSTDVSLRSHIPLRSYSCDFKSFGRLSDDTEPSHYIVPSSITVRARKQVKSWSSECAEKQVMAVEEDGKYKLDMRGISQKDGTDTDPNNLERSSRSKSGTFYRQDPIKLEAVLNVTCTRCKGTGHMRHECYNTTGEVYELLEEESGSAAAPASAVVSTTAKPSPVATGANAVQLQKPLPTPLQKEAEKEDEKKHRTESSKKRDGGKHKRNRHYSSSSSGSDTSSSSESRRKKSRKKKGKKKKDSKKKKRRS